MNIPVTYVLSDAQNGMVIREEQDRGDAEEARAVLEDANGRQIDIFEVPFFPEDEEEIAEFWKHYS